LVAAAKEDRLSFSAADNGQQGKSPGSEAGARLGFACHGVTRDESGVMDTPPFPQRAFFGQTSEV